MIKLLSFTKSLGNGLRTFNTLSQGPDHLDPSSVSEDIVYSVTTQ